MPKPPVMGVRCSLKLTETTTAMRKLEPAKLLATKTSPTSILKRGKNGSTELVPIPPPVPEPKIPKK